MAEPPEGILDEENLEPDTESVVALLQRWIERPDGSLDLLEIPLTPKDFLDPHVEDKWIQGWRHSRTLSSLYLMLYCHFRSEQDVIVLCDMKHLLGPGLPGPAPDISIVRGVRDPDPDMYIYSAMEQGIVPCLIIEILAPFDARIRRTDEVDKVALYQRISIPEYLLVDLPRRATGHRFRVKGHRLNPEGRYRPIEPDAQGFLLSETTHLRFGVSAAGDQIEVIDARTGQRLLGLLELDDAHEAAKEKAAREAQERRAAEERAAREEQGRRAAEEKAAREEVARKAAEAELERLRAEIDLLKKSDR